MAGEFNGGIPMEHAHPALRSSVNIWHDEDTEFATSNSGYSDFQTSVRECLPGVMIRRVSG